MTRTFVKSLIPPILLEARRRLFNSSGTLRRPFEFWDEAMRHCSGYEDPKLIENIVQRNVAEDGPGRLVLTDRDLQIVSAVLVAANRSRKTAIHVLDFGGELGSFFRTLVRLAACGPITKWTVIETLAMIEKGRALFAKHGLDFRDSLKGGDPADIVLASGSLQCVENPRATFEELALAGADQIVLSIVPLIPQPSDVLTARPRQGGHSYPLWMFSELRFRAMISHRHNIVAEWDVPKEDTLHDGTNVRYYGFLIETKH